MLSLQWSLHPYLRAFSFGVQEYVLFKNLKEDQFLSLPIPEWL